MKVLIYSNRRNAWWGKDFAGYCSLIEDAGIYELDDVLSRSCYSGFDFDKKKGDYLVKLEDVMDEFAKRKSELLDQQKVLEEKIASIANIVFAINQIEKGGTEMKKKAKDFTDEEVRRFCDKYDCYTCPFSIMPDGNGRPICAYWAAQREIETLEESE